MTFDVALPYRTDWRELIAVLDYCKGKGADRAALEARFGGGESLRETLNALEQFGLIERGEAGDVRLSRRGDRLAYAPDPAQVRGELLDALLDYRPYRVPLERAAAEGVSILEGPAVERIWQVDMRLGQPRNRVEEARTLFFRLCDEAGLGMYRRGVRGQTTRLDLPPDAQVLLRRSLATWEERRAVDTLPELPAGAPGTDAQPVSGELAAPYPAAGAALAPRVAGAPQIAIQVDLSSWELDKIEAFLRMIGYLPQRPD